MRPDPRRRHGARRRRSPFFWQPRLVAAAPLACVRFVAEELDAIVDTVKPVAPGGAAL
ncbi:hypothetical protein WMF18_26945 [Sorangium sp. So ce315]|uniref:hypothetical protein n=1 Tax=Sorangium sp. So ce315 TaxID=3133299 RepID=UPI003F60AEAD